MNSKRSVPVATTFGNQEGLFFLVGVNVAPTWYNSGDLAEFWLKAHLEEYLLNVKTVIEQPNGTHGH